MAYTFVKLCKECLPISFFYLISYTYKLVPTKVGSFILSLTLSWSCLMTHMFGLFVLFTINVTCAHYVL